jgi:hypothetical protein
VSGVEAAFLEGNTMITIQQKRVRAFVAGVSFVPAPILPQFYQVFSRSANGSPATEANIMNWTTMNNME